MSLFANFLNNSNTSGGKHHIQFTFISCDIAAKVDVFIQGPNLKCFKFIYQFFAVDKRPVCQAQTIYYTPGSHAKALKGLSIEHKSPLNFKLLLMINFLSSLLQNRIYMHLILPKIGTLNVKSQRRRARRLLENKATSNGALVGLILWHVVTESTFWF